MGYVLFVDGPAKLLAALAAANLWWLGCCGLCMLVYWVLEARVLHLVAHRLSPMQRFRNTFSTSMIGQLFNCITPFASGGQPIQAYHMVRTGMPLGLASSALLSKFIIYQTVLTLYSLVVLVFRFAFFSSTISGFGVLVFVGFALNTLVVLGLICVGFFPTLTRGLLRWLVHLLGNARLLKDPETTLQRGNTEIGSFYESFLLLRGNLSLLIRMSLLTALQLTAFFTIPYFVCLALGVGGADYFTVISAGAFVMMISSFVPLPGAAGGAEGSFFLFFQMFFPTGILGVAIIVWRLVTFYLPIAAGTFFANGLTQKKVQTLSE